MIKERVPSKCDALIIGSGGAGLVAALTVKDLRPDWSVWLVEQSNSIGGATSYSGGVCWLPGHRFKKDPSKDSELARIYLKNTYPAIDDACLNGFLNDSPRLLDFMISKGLQLETLPDYPDYYQELEGASAGRSISALVYKGPKMIRSLVRRLPWFFPSFSVKEFMEWGPHRMGRWKKTVMVKRTVLGHLAMGRAFIGYLLDACLNAGIDIALSGKAEGLLIQNAEVTGAVVSGHRVSAPIVIMGCGGFSHHPELMKRLATARPVLSVAPEECDDGGGLSLALNADLKVGNPYCWWMPLMKLYGEDEKKPGPDLWAYYPTVYDRARPGGIMVDAEGRRFTNEAACYNTVGGIMALNKDPSLDRIWLIWGSYYVKNYPRGITINLQPAKSYMNKSRSVDELAGKIGVPAANLKETLEHWNEMAARGRDDDFHRGESAYDRFTGDRFYQGHPNIGPVEAPFQAVRLHPGCLGTKMGPVTDEFGRVQSEDGKIVSGLYAAGNAAASLFGDTYPGAGATLGQACVFGFRAAYHASGVKM
ncbi:MAG: FAD-dependent oxidoreductase [Deltaproteobacteria bacterium]|nr:MAG: FAD-dependent oxidoreductase [Deltaproteobacteria bacterium]